MMSRPVWLPGPMFLPGGLPDRDPLGQKRPEHRPPSIETPLDRDPPWTDPHTVKSWRYAS